jgi:hypothetical protein
VRNRTCPWAPSLRGCLSVILISNDNIEPSRSTTGPRQMREHHKTTRHVTVWCRQRGAPKRPSQPQLKKYPTYLQPNKRAGFAKCLVEGLLLVGIDRAVGGGVCDARQHEAAAHLGVVQERLVRLVDRAARHLAGARGARASAARVRQVEAGLLRMQAGRAQGSSGRVHTAEREGGWRMSRRF